MKRGGWIASGLIAMAVAGALGHTAQVLGQDAPAPGQKDDLVMALSERVRALEDGARGDEWDWPAAWLAAVAAVPLIEAVHRVLTALRNRTRPVLSWAEFGDGLKFSLGVLPDGSWRLAIRITNVGQAAAVDIVGYVGTRVSAHAGARIRPGSRRHVVGSLHPGASAQVPIPLSAGEHERVTGNETAMFEVELLYKSINNRVYRYMVTGMYSAGLEFLEGAVSGALPERARRVSRRSGARARLRRAGARLRRRGRRPARK